MLILRGNKQPFANTGLILFTLILLLTLIQPGSSSGQDRLYDATVLALELGGPSGEIRASESTIQSLQDDLIRATAFEPYLANVNARPPWMLGEVIVDFTPEAHAEFEAGTFEGFDGIFNLYPLAGVRAAGSCCWVVFSFEEPLNSENLAQLFVGIDGVVNAFPNRILGVGGDITCTAPRSYRFKYAWGDCASGCIYGHTWEIMLDEQTVWIVNEYGWDVPLASDGLTLGGLKALFR